MTPKPESGSGNMSFAMSANGVRLVVSVPDGFIEAAEGATAINIVIGKGSGGCTAAAFRIIDAIRESGATTTATILEYAASSHAMIFLAADKRIMRPGAMLMLHAPTTAAYGTALELRQALDGLDQCAGRMMAFLQERTPLPEEVIERLLYGGQDFWFSVDEVLSLGLLDTAAQ
jgi:ATP-dependent Clp protease, protease subunit